jgi:hypothetical protein
MSETFTREDKGLAVTVTDGRVTWPAHLKAGRLYNDMAMPAELVIAIEEKIRAGEPSGEVEYNGGLFLYEVHRPGA